MLNGEKPHCWPATEAQVIHPLSKMAASVTGGGRIEGSQVEHKQRNLKK